MRWSFAFVVAATACGSSSPPGMVARVPVTHAEDARLIELARVASASDRRALLVVYPRDACSGSASTVFLDEDGRFVGAVAPGSAALLDIPASTKTLIATSAVEISAPKGMPTYQLVALRMPPVPDGLLLRSRRLTQQRCSLHGQYAEVHHATKPELEAALAEADVQWLSAHETSGQAWLDENRARVSELLATPR